MHARRSYNVSLHQLGAAHRLNIVIFIIIILFLLFLLWNHDDASITFEVTRADRFNVLWRDTDSFESAAAVEEIDACR